MFGGWNAGMLRNDCEKKRNRDVNGTALRIGGERQLKGKQSQW